MTPLEFFISVKNTEAAKSGPLRDRLAGILTVLGYALDKDDAYWMHPFGPVLADDDLGGRIPNEVALVRWIFETGMARGGEAARVAMRQALGLPRGN